MALPGNNFNARMGAGSSQGCSRGHDSRAEGER